MAPKEAGGTGGIIPHRHIPRLLKLAVEIGVSLDYAAFFEAPSSDSASLGHAGLSGPDAPVLRHASGPDLDHSATEGLPA